ncbi:hypothetical protein ACGFNX_05445 [Streptomyces sp. NPDC048723]|uniref:hypothetical protein n=1 Tax=Streptomyces sp. NPDC048723 TaxID=3365589 RepID=UPI00371D20D5
MGTATSTTSPSDHGQPGEFPAGSADIAFVVHPAAFVLVAAHRDVTEEDVAVLQQAWRVGEFVGI